MATIGVGAGSYIRPHRRVRMRRFKEDSSQTFKVGDPVCLSADSGDEDHIKVAAADPTTDRGFVGFAAQAASGTKGNWVDVWLATGDAEFIGHVCGAAVADQALAASQIASEFGLLADSPNAIWRVDISETTAKIVRILDLADAAADVNGRVIFHVIAPERLYHD